MIAIPSVSRAGGTLAWVRDMLAIRVGAMATPPTSSRRPISGTEPTK